MKNFLSLLSWIFALIFFLLFILSLLSKHYLPAFLVLLITLLIVPPSRQWINDLIGSPLPLWIRSVVILLFFFLFIFLIFQNMGNKYSIYKTPEIEKKLMGIYAERLKKWPVPFETRYIETGYGKVHVIISGPKEGPPIFLLHASAMAGWSWLYNIAGLNRTYRTYAVDTIGDAGRSILSNIEVYPADGQSLADLYAEIMDSLHIPVASFVGASQGGFITTNMALYAPERVEKLILCGPMGYSGTNLSVLRILFTTMFPIKPIKQSAHQWAFGDNAYVKREVGEWFSLILEGVISRQARPIPFTIDQLERLNVPVLLLLGNRDGLVGDPDDSKELAEHISNCRVEVLDTGHLISAEKPDQFNRLVLDFLGTQQEQ